MWHGTFGLFVSSCAWGSEISKKSGCVCRDDSVVEDVQTDEGVAGPAQHSASAMAHIGGANPFLDVRNQLMCCTDPVCFWSV